MAAKKKDIEAINKDLIIRNAWSSKLKCLKLYLISGRKDSWILEYDIIIPRKGKANSVTDLILSNHKLKDELN